MFPYVLAIFMVVSAEIVQDANPTGILFTKIAETQVTHSDWRLCYHYELAQSEQELPKLEHCILSLERICKAITQENQIHICWSILELLHSRLSQIQETDRIIRSYQSANVRKRRAPLEIVGSVASYLFGTLDKSDAERYDTKILQLERNQSFHKEMIAEQMTLVRSELILHNSTYSEVRSKLDSFSRELDKLTGWLALAEERLELQSRFGFLAQLAQLIASHHDEVTEAILNLLASVSKGRVVGLIPIKQLVAGLAGISDNIDSRTELPIGKNESAYHIFRFAPVRTHITETRLLIELTIPILDRERFTLYEATSIPTEFKGSNELIMIKPEETHFLTNTEFNKFVPMLPEEVKACQPLREERIFCSQAAATLTLEHRNCELTLLNDLSSSNVPDTCVLTRVPKRNYVIKLPEANHYYLVVSHPFKTKMFCQDHSQSISLSNNAFVRLEEGCMLVGQEFSVRARGRTRSSSQRIEVPSLNLSNFSFTELEKHNHSSSKTLVVRDFKTEFQTLSKQITDSEREAKHLEGLSLNRDSASPHDVTLYLLVSILTLVFLLSYVYSRRENWWDHPRTVEQPQLEGQLVTETAAPDNLPALINEEPGTTAQATEPIYARIRIQRT